MMEMVEDIEKKQKANQKDNDPSKRRNYKKELESVSAENQELKEQLLRVAAEFENYKKRVDRERSALFENANSSLIAALLPVLDDFDRSMDAETNNHECQSLLEGFKLVQKKFLKTLQDQGLQLMKAIGEKFDPEKHEAMMQMEVEGIEPELVVEDHVKGYEFKNRVIRHAKVIVSK